MNLVQAVITEAGIYPPSAENRQGEWTWDVASRFEFSAIVARVCEKNIEEEDEEKFVAIGPLLSALLYLREKKKITYNTN